MNLKPGRELDYAVAEHVMGWRTIDMTYEGDINVYSTWIKPNGDKTSVPSFSEDIAAAWEAGLKAGVFDDLFGLNKWRDGWSFYDRYERDVIVEAKTAPHAICLAALKAVGYGEEK